MVTTLMTSVNNADFIPEIWINEILLRLREELFLIQNVTKDSELSGAQEVGDVINVPKTGALTAQQKTETGDIVLQAPSSGNVQISLNQHWHVAFGGSSVLRAQASQDLMEGYMQDAVGVLAEKVETSIGGVYASAAYQEGAAGTDFDEELILEIRSALNTNKAPKRGRQLWISDKDEQALLKIDRFTSAEKIGQAGKIAEGAIGRIHGFDVFQSNLVTLAAGPTYHNLAFLRGGICLASRPLPEIRSAISYQMADPYSGLVIRVTFGYNGNANEDQVVIDVLWGVGILRDEFVVDVLS